METVTHELAITTSTELAHPDARRTALAKLNREAEQVTSPDEARRIMLQAKLIAELLESAKAPLEEARLAGKASVVAGRKVGRFLEQANPVPLKVSGLQGSAPSDRGLLKVQLGLSDSQALKLRRLAQLEDPFFQSYIQLTDRIPSITGCLTLFYAKQYPRNVGKTSWREVRRRRAGVKRPKNPSVEEAHSLVVRALGHLSSTFSQHGLGKAQRDISSAMDHLYAAEDLLKPHLGGYTK